jgi:hypothetical protein
VLREDLIGMALPTGGVLTGGGRPGRGKGSGGRRSSMIVIGGATGDTHILRSRAGGRRLGVGVSGGGLSGEVNSKQLRVLDEQAVVARDVVLEVKILRLVLLELSGETSEGMRWEMSRSRGRGRRGRGWFLTRRGWLALQKIFIFRKHHSLALACGGGGAGAKGQWSSRSGQDLHEPDKALAGEKTDSGGGTEDSSSPWNGDRGGTRALS